jgi:hypothetical protein
MIENSTNTTIEVLSTKISVLLAKVHDPLETGYYIVAIFLFVLAYQQLKSCWKANNINLFGELYTENKRIRELQSDARTQLRLLMAELITKDTLLESKFEEFYAKSTPVVIKKPKDGETNHDWKVITKTKKENFKDNGNFTFNTLRNYMNKRKFHCNYSDIL